MDGSALSFCIEEDVRQKMKRRRSFTGKEQFKQHSSYIFWPHCSAQKRCTSVALLLFSVQNAAESLSGKTSRQRDRTNRPSVTFKVDQSIFPSQLSHMATARGFPSCTRGRVSLNSCQSHPSHRQEPSSNAWELPPRPHQNHPYWNNHTDLHSSSSSAWCHFLSFLVFPVSSKNPCWWLIDSTRLFVTGSTFDGS